MPTPTTFASALSFYGVAKETVQGTAVPMTATIPLDKFEPEDLPKMLLDNAARGAMVEDYDNILGAGHSQCSFGGPVYADSIGYLVAGLLGDVATTGTAAPFTHAISTLNSGTGQPTSYTFEDYSGLGAFKARLWPGQMIEEISFKFNADGLFTFDGKSQGWLSSAAGATPTSAPSAVAALPVWKMAVGIAGPASAGTLVSNVSEGEVTISRKLQVVQTADGNNQPFIVRAGKISATGKLKFVVADETPLTQFLTNAQPQLQIVMDSGLTGANSAKVQIDVQKAAYQATKINRGQETVEMDVDFRAIANTTNAGASGGYSPAKVTLTNAVTASTYA